MTKATPNEVHHSPDVLIVGAGPAGSAAALHAANRGYSVLLTDKETFPRDKTCGDGLTPRAITQLDLLGITVTDAYHNLGLKLHGYGGSHTIAWPKSAFGQTGSAMPRSRFDALLFNTAKDHPGVTTRTGHAATGVELSHGKISAVTFADGHVVKPKFVLVADGVRSTFGKQLGRTWHRGEVYGIAARSYCETPRHQEPWIHSHLELRDQDDVVQPGYGWIFPLGDGHANVGCGALATEQRPAKINTKKLLHHYAATCGDGWNFSTPEHVTSALLPMGGAVSNVAGPNWMLLGDAAACVNPLNGEGIDYALETAHLAAGILDEAKDLTLLWPHLLRCHYGNAFLLARTAARALTYPKFLPAAAPIAMRGPGSKTLMLAAARLMGNLVTEEDTDLVARAWRGAGKGLERLRGERPLWS